MVNRIDSERKFKESLKKIERVVYAWNLDLTLEQQEQVNWDTMIKTSFLTAEQLKKVDEDIAFDEAFNEIQNYNSNRVHNIL